MQDQEILPNKAGNPGRRRFKKDLCEQRVFLVPRTSGMYSGGGVAAVASSPARVRGRK